MATRFRFYQFARDANERATNSRDVDVLPIPTLDERVTLYLRAVHGNRDFTEEERSNARNVLLDAMAAEFAAQAIPAEQSRKGELPDRETNGAGRGSFLARYSLPEESVQGQERAIEPEITKPRPLHPSEAAAQHSQSVQRKEAIRVAPIARRRTSILALTATLGLVLIVTGGTLGYRWTYPHMADEVTPPAEQAGVPPPTTSPRSLPTRPAPDKAAREQHMLQIVSHRSEADVLAVFRKLQGEHPTLLGQATLRRIDRGLQSYTAQAGPFASEKDAAAACRALDAADIRCSVQ